jgi:hypothetical protein
MAIVGFHRTRYPAKWRYSNAGADDVALTPNLRGYPCLAWMLVGMGADQQTEACHFLLPCSDPHLDYSSPAGKGRLIAKGHIRDAQEGMKSWLAVRKLCDLSVAAYSVDVRSRQKHCWQTSIRFQGLNAQIEDSSLAKEVSLCP